VTFWKSHSIYIFVPAESKTDTWLWSIWE
jgi:hypothetical protein